MMLVSSTFFPVAHTILRDSSQHLYLFFSAQRFVGDTTYFHLFHCLTNYREALRYLRGLCGSLIFKQQIDDNFLEGIQVSIFCEFRDVCLDYVTLVCAEEKE